MTADSGAGAHIGNGGKTAAVNKGAAGIDTEFRHGDSGGNLKVCGGNTQSPAQLLTVQNLTGQHMGVTKITGGAFHVSGFEQTPDQGRGDPLALTGLFRHNDTGKTQFGAEGQQLFGISFSPTAETEIVTADEAGGALLQQLLQKLLPRS